MSAKPGQQLVFDSKSHSQKDNNASEGYAFDVVDKAMNGRKMG